MNPELEAIIDKNAAVLVRKLDVNGGILNRLLSRGVITSDHLDEIKAEKTVRQRNELLLNILKKRDDKYYFIFREEVSKEQEQLAKDHLPLQVESLPHPVKEESGN